MADTSKKGGNWLGMIVGLAITAGIVYGSFWVASKGWNAGKK